jgi:hypothetical protein
VKTVATYEAISRVSDAMLELVRDEMLEHEGVLVMDRDQIALTSPDAVGPESNIRVSLYLFEVDRSEQQQGQSITDDGVKKGSPLPLNLRYLLTAYPGDSSGETGNNRDQHSMLGLAVQVFHDNGTLGPEQLGDEFADDTDITVKMIDEADSVIARVWDTFRDVPRYPSIAYEVSPVLIESTREEEFSRVTERETRIDRRERPPVKRDPDMEREDFDDLFEH